MSKLYAFQNGTLADADQVNDNTAFLCRNLLQNAGSGLFQGTRLSTITSYTGYNITGTGIVASGSTWDNFYDSIINTTKHGSYFSTVGNLGSPVGSQWYESGSTLYIIGSSIRFFTGGLSSENMVVQYHNKYMFGTGGSETLMYFNGGALAQGNGQVSGYIKFVLAGSNLANITVSNGATVGFTGSFLLKVNSDKTYAYLYQNGALYSTTNITNSANGSFSIQIGMSAVNGTPNAPTGSIQISDMRILGSDISTYPEYVYNNDGYITTNIMSAYVPVSVGSTSHGTTGSIYVSFNNGTNYTLCQNGSNTYIPNSLGSLITKHIYNVPYGGSFVHNTLGYIYG